MYRFLLACALLLHPVYAQAESQFIIVRHGEAEHNVKGHYNADPIHPAYEVSNLTQTGITQAQQTAQNLIRDGFDDERISVVYVSPLPRAIQTAEVMAETGLFSKNKITIDHRLTEIQIGNLEGKALIRPWNSSLCETYQTETDEAFLARIDDFYKSTLIRPDENVMVVTHQLVAKFLIKTITREQHSLGTSEAFLISSDLKPN